MPNDSTKWKSLSLFADNDFDNAYSNWEKNDIVDIKNEVDFSGIKQNSWKEHSDLYTKMLQIYVDNAQTNQNIKMRQKKAFFRLAITILAFSVLISIFLLWYGTKIDDTNTKIIVSILPSFFIFLSSLLIIPRSIANYLFTTKDDENMIEILKQIIDHDKNSVH